MQCCTYWFCMSTIKFNCVNIGNIFLDVLAEDVSKEVINASLPEQIRVLDIRRVTKGFNSKNSCDGRTYSYTCPTFAFASPEATIDFNYRIDSTVIDKINEILKCFLGCHNYHNYTSKK